MSDASKEFKVVSTTSDTKTDTMQPTCTDEQLRILKDLPRDPFLEKMVAKLRKGYEVNATYMWFEVPGDDKNLPVKFVEGNTTANKIQRGEYEHDD